MNHADMPAANGDTAAAAPVVGADRIGSLDFIRGLAVMGILAANIVAFGQPSSAYMFPDAFLVPSGDQGGWLWIAQFLLIDGKMRGLFTLLFGAGLYLFMERAWARGATRWLQARRLFFLLLFGLAHFFLVWFGDILTYYALCGFIVLLCLRWRAKTQLVVGLGGYILGALAYAAIFVPLHFIADTPMGKTASLTEMRSGLEESKAKAFAEDEVETGLISSGDYSGFVAHRITEHTFEPLANVLLFCMESIPLMLIGVALYRLGFFGGGFERRDMIRWGWIGLAVGGAIHVAIALWARQVGFTYYGNLAAFMGFSPLPRLFMVLGLAALLVAYSPGWTGWLGQRIVAAGRAAFSNYLGTSIVMLFVFHGWALGLYGELNRPQLYLVVALAWVAMLAWSKPWLARFRYGPLEWLWRSLTYGKLFALRR
ncbi:DUF418 domain-containing protein [Altererythrobacter sp. Z27]|uniref:DUF418 domain-containing protein n=1 Tax=Altererythrobacter sp. Z27 TaxID=3461147 RepID=UPI004043E61A